MCGIAGLVGWGDRELLSRMTDIQRHRGPDDSGLWEVQVPGGPWVGLGSRRLAILDLSQAGHMPMSTPDGSCTIVYNGEIYNHRELRQELEKKGYRFRSSSDTETLLYLYEEFGTNAFPRLNGMFALALWDAARRQLVLARDHFGIKPLYYTVNAGRLAFASEMKALLVSPDVRKQISFEALNYYLTFLWLPEPLTLVEGIFKLPPGHYGVFKNGELTLVEYWDLRFPPDNHVFRGDPRDLAQETRERFALSVRGQLLSDVPVGAFLSAGLDSSSIVAAMAQHSHRPVETFTITFPEHYRSSGIILDDPAVAARTARHFGCKHTELVVEPDVVSLLPKLVWHMDDPTADPAIIMAYLVCREARRNVTVLLSGVGGDELFAGYRKYQAHYWAAYYERMPKAVREKVLERLIRWLPEWRAGPLQAYVRLAKKMARSASLQPEDRFLMQSVYLSKSEKAKLYTDEVAKELLRLDSHAMHLAHFRRMEKADFVNQMLYVDTKTFMTSLNLNYNDKMSMASSMEVRVPFLDWQLAEWVAWNVPPSLKLKGGSTKHILREAMKPVLPAEVLRQKKAGFGAPVDRWLDNELKLMVDDVLAPAVLAERGLFRSSSVWRIIEEHRSGRRDWSMQIWQLLTLELWMRAFLDRK